jgi:uncharacterized protein YndB with AHSA1/START domain
MDAQLSPAGDRWQLRFERHLAHPQEKVWRAITEPEHIAAWFPDEVQGDFGPGAPLKFHFAEHPEYDFTGEVLVFDPPSVLELRWGDDNLRFELEPRGDGCLLTFVDTFDEVGKAARDGAGWHVCLDQLESHLSGTPSDADQRTRWNEVNGRYVAELGPEASTIGPPDGF